MHAQAFLQEVLANPTEDCVWWPYAHTAKGRLARVWNRRIGKTDAAYRVLWEMYYERPFPEGLLARHTCHNGRQGCVNPRPPRAGLLLHRDASHLGTDEGAPG